jgi:surface protein
MKCENCQPGDTVTVNGVLYEAVDKVLLEQRRDEGADLTILCTSLVTDMAELFAGMEDFNQDIGSWDVSNVSDMSWMFAWPTEYDLNLSTWCVEKIATLPENFCSSSLRSEYYPVLGTCPYTLAIDENDYTGLFEIYPNPTKDLIYVDSKASSSYKIVITSLNGQLIISEIMGGAKSQFDLSSFQKGVYLITIRSKYFVATRNIVKL